jgi:hypothetical protein
MPSGTPSPRSAHTRRSAKSPSGRTENAVNRFAYDSATISVEPSGVSAMPLPKAMSSATARTAPSGEMNRIAPGR